jgi:hypothetical protein
MKQGLLALLYQSIRVVTFVLGYKVRQIRVRRVALTQPY